MEIFSVKIILRSYLIVMIGILTLLPTASAEQIIFKPTTGNSIVIHDKAIANGGDIFISVDVVRDYLASGVVVDPAESRLQLTAPETFLGSGGTLNFLTRNIGKREYISLRRLDLLFGIRWQYDPQTKDLLIEQKKGKEDKPGLLTRNKWTPVGKITLVWDYIVKYSPELALRERISGLNVLSPTWFRVGAADGMVVNHADARYVADAHAQGYQVWPLVTNSFDSELTHQFFQDQVAQEATIHQLALYAALYDFDGLNIDFENIEDGDAGAFIAFTERLTAILHRQNLIVSVDVTVPSNVPNWSRCYDRKKLGAIVDYVMVMTYDEHWSRSPVSGSVASLPWVRAGIEKMLLEVPPQKLLLGIPFYTREWRETVADTGKITVKSKALSMAGASERLTEYGETINWLNDAGQYYFEYSKDGAVYKIWLEEARSIKLKAQLVNQYQLAGAACWRQGFENPDVWLALEEVLKVRGGYDRKNP